MTETETPIPMIEQFVVVTEYHPAVDMKTIVHVWGPWPTRSRATTAKDRMRREDRRSFGGERTGEVSYWVRPVLSM